MSTPTWWSKQQWNGDIELQTVEEKEEHKGIWWREWRELETLLLKFKTSRVKVYRERKFSKLMNITLASSTSIRNNCLCD
jgi:hypothetical protein